MKQHTEGGVLLRLLTALVLVTTVLVLIWTPILRLPFTLFAAFLVAVGLHEYFGMIRALNVEAESTGGIVAGTAVVLAAYGPQPGVMALTLTAGLLAVMVLHLFRGKHSLAGLSASVLGVAYIGWFAAHFVALHGFEGEGPGLVTFLLVAVVFSDTGAYFIGKGMGRHKLAPKVSPKKTWEGAVGGVLAAMLSVAVLYALRVALAWDTLPDWSLPAYVVIGAVLAVIGQVGDLVESMLKRDAGVKDAGGLFPGHGGVLDRCDSILFAGPALYYIVWIGARF